MRSLTCAATRRRLHAYHDRELGVSDQIAVGAHLEWCSACAAALADVRLVQTAVRLAAPGRTPLSSEEAASFHASIVGRVNVEREVSLTARLQLMFEDMHLIYAGIGAAAAALACLIVMLGMMRLARIERPDSLAAILAALATPGSNENPVAIDSHVRLPRALDGAFSSAASDGSAEEDAVFTLAAIVTREGRIEKLELLQANSGQSAPNEARFVEGLLDAVARARFEPASVAGLPVAVNMVWLVAHTTVRATKPIDLPVPPAGKKRAAESTTDRLGALTT